MCGACTHMSRFLVSEIQFNLTNNIINNSQDDNSDDESDMDANNHDGSPLSLSSANGSAISLMQPPLLSSMSSSSLVGSIGTRHSFFLCACACAYVLLHWCVLLYCVHVRLHACTRHVFVCSCALVCTHGTIYVLYHMSHYSSFWFLFFLSIMLILFVYRRWLVFCFGVGIDIGSG